MILQLIANEREVAEDLIKGKKVELSQGKQLYILSKYYFNTLPKTYFDERGKEILLKDRVKENLHSYLRDKSNSNYIWEMKESFLRKVIKDTQDSELIEIESVVVFQEEVELIRKLNNIDKEKFIFSMLVESKLKSQIRGSQEYWSNLDSNDLCKLANIKKSKPTREKYINEFMNDGLIKIVNRISKIDRCLLFVGGKNYLLDIYSFKDLGLQYEKYILGNKKVIECDECGDLIYANSNRIKYCKVCSPNINKEKTKENMRLIRNV